MGLNIQSGVIGCVAIPRFDDDSLSLEELLYSVTRAALNDAGLAIDDIDGIVVAANDQYDGRAISIMAASGSVGGVDRDILSTPSSGEHAFVLGTLRVASGPLPHAVGSRLEPLGGAFVAGSATPSRRPLFPSSLAARRNGQSCPAGQRN